MSHDLHLKEYRQQQCYGTALLQDCTDVMQIQLTTTAHREHRSYYPEVQTTARLYRLRRAHGMPHYTSLCSSLDLQVQCLRFFRGG